MGRFGTIFDDFVDFDDFRGFRGFHAALGLFIRNFLVYLESRWSEWFLEKFLIFIKQIYNKTKTLFLVDLEV